MRHKMSKQAKKELVVAVKAHYQQASRKEKADLLVAFVAATGYNRKYAIQLLSVNEANGPPVPRERKRYYDEEVAAALRTIWLASNRLCSKRLIAFLPRFIPQLEKFGHLQVSKEVRAKLLSISPATADRILKADRKKLGRRGICTTKPGTLLKHHIPIRTFSEWNDCEPGFLEADTVSHCGPVAKGQFLSTLTLTDIASGWTELVALEGKTESAVTAALSHVAGIIPFRLRGLDTDNGSEFINEGVHKWCVGGCVTFTRSREYKKNDQAHVEQKNGSIVREFVGYDRYAGSIALQKMRELYRVVRLYVNFFQPSMKLRLKERIGSRVRKQYYRARTPCEQLLESSLPESTKRRLRSEMSRLDPLALLGQIQRLQVELHSLSTVPDPELIAQESLMRLLSPESELAQTLSKAMEAREHRGGRKKRLPLQPPVQDDRTVAERMTEFIAAKATLAQSFQIHELLHLGERSAIDQALQALRKEGIIERIGWGKYKPIKTNFGQILNEATGLSGFDF